MQPESKTKSKVELLKERSRIAEEGGGAARIEKQKAAGKMTARERVAFFLDDDSFEEFDKFVVHRSTDFGMDEQKFSGDGVITGHGLVDGRAFTSKILRTAAASSAFAPRPYTVSVGKATRRPLRSSSAAFVMSVTAFRLTKRTIAGSAPLVRPASAKRSVAAASDASSSWRHSLI